MIRFRRRLAFDDRGLSLAELLVAMMLSMLVVTMSAMFFVQTARITTATNKAQASTSQAINVANVVTAPIRVATSIPTSSGMIPAIYSARAERVVFFAYLSTAPTEPTPAPTKVDLQVASDGRVVMTTCGLTKVGSVYREASCLSPSSRTLDVRVDNRSSFFTFNDVNGGSISLVGSAIPAAALRNITSITINAAVGERGSDAEPVTIRNTVQMPNIGIR